MKEDFNKLLQHVRKEIGTDTADLLERWFTEYMMSSSSLTRAPYILRGILYTLRTCTGGRSMTAYYATRLLSKMNDVDWRGSYL